MRYMYCGAIISTFQTMRLMDYSPTEIRSIQHVNDCFLLIDGKELYHIGPSIKELGKKWCAFFFMDSLVEEIELKLAPRLRSAIGRKAFYPPQQIRKSTIPNLSSKD